MLAQVEEDARIRRLLLVVAEQDEWTVVRLKGKLDAFVEDAIRYAFDEADRPDLYATSARQPGWERPEAVPEPPLSAVAPGVMAP